MTKVGIIGAGFGAKIHIPGFKSLPDVQVVGIASRSTEKVETIAKQNEIIAFASWKELITDPQIEAVSIATPPSLHYEMASFAIKNGKHVFLEKPIAMDATE